MVVHHVLKGPRSDHLTEGHGDHPIHQRLERSKVMADDHEGHAFLALGCQKLGNLGDLADCQAGKDLIQQP